MNAPRPADLALAPALLAAGVALCPLPWPALVAWLAGVAVCGVLARDLPGRPADPPAATPAGGDVTEAQLQTSLSELRIEKALQRIDDASGRGSR